jgi:hypothetical protein
MNDNRLLHRVTHGTRSLYCGYENHLAAMHYFEVEPAATAEEPVEWKAFLVPDVPTTHFAEKLVRKAPPES